MDNQNQILRTRGLRAAPFGYRETPLSGPLSQPRQQMLSKKVELYILQLIIETMIYVKSTDTEFCRTENLDNRSMTAITRKAIPKERKNWQRRSETTGNNQSE